MASKAAEQRVRSWGFDSVFTWRDSPNAHYTPHRHDGLSTHLILSGSLTITYPKDDNGPHPDCTGGTEEVVDGKMRWTYKTGDRVDVDAGRYHEVWVGGGGCVYVIGE